MGGDDKGIPRSELSKCITKAYEYYNNRSIDPNDLEEIVSDLFQMLSTEDEDMKVLSLKEFINIMTTNSLTLNTDFNTFK